MYDLKIDLRMNSLTLAATETLHMSVLEQLTHLDIRLNNVTELDLRSLRCLEYLNVERNRLHTLHLNGDHIKTVFSAHNGTYLRTRTSHPLTYLLPNHQPTWHILTSQTIYLRSIILIHTPFVCPAHSESIMNTYTHTEYYAA